MAKKSEKRKLKDKLDKQGMSQKAMEGMQQAAMADIARQMIPHRNQQGIPGPGQARPPMIR